MDDTREKITLDKLPVGESCVLCQVGNQRGAVKRRLIDMGLTPGTEVKLIKIAPFGDPMELRLRGYELSLRKEDAAQIQIRPVSGKDAGKSAVPETAYHLGGGCHGDCAHCAVGCADPKDLEAMRQAHRHEQSHHPQTYDPTAHDHRQCKVALVGNPNCGKTTLFNALTGSNQYVGNWPGVTVEKKEGTTRLGDKTLTVVDLPGIYSLSPYSMEEIVTRDFIIEEEPDCVIDIVDATNLERNLYLTTQVLEMGIPVVVALNMMDVVKKSGDKIDAVRLSQKLGCAVIEVSALKGTGLTELYAKAVEVAQAKQWKGHQHEFAPAVESALGEIEQLIRGSVPEHQLRWYAVKLFEQDEKIVAELSKLGLDEQFAQIISGCEKAMDDESESIITNERYEYITSILSDAYRKSRTGMSTSDRIDRVVTNRVLALPIFAAIMLAVYTIAMGSTSISFGTMGTDWVNDVLFGEIVPPAVEGFLVSIGCADWLVGLINDGIVAGVGAALGFVPQILVLSFLLAILEDIGYMARIAFVMDRIFRRFGLSGKSFIPLLVASGCGIPGVMASRTIEQDRDRKLTVMTTCFIPCSAKMPIIGLLAGAIFGGSSLVATSAYFIGIAAVVVSGIILKKTRAFAGDPAPFVMELPAYHVPAWGNVLRATCFAAMGAIKREMNNARWTAIAIGYMCLLAYCTSLVVYQLGGLITGEVGFNLFTVVAAALVALALWLLFRPNKYEGVNDLSVDAKTLVASR